MKNAMFLSAAPLRQPKSDWVPFGSVPPLTVGRTVGWKSSVAAWVLPMVNWVSMYWSPSDSKYSTAV